MPNGARFERSNTVDNRIGRETITVDKVDRCAKECRESGQVVQLEQVKTVVQLKNFSKEPQTPEAQ